MTDSRTRCRAIFGDYEAQALWMADHIRERSGAHGGNVVEAATVMAQQWPESLGSIVIMAALAEILADAECVSRIAKRKP